MKGRMIGGRWFPPPEFYSRDLCTRCGVCCGSNDGHPCEHLIQDPDGSYRCAIYENRLGPHKTADGYSFICVPIQMIIERDGGYAECGYVREIKRLRSQMGQDSSDLGRLKQP